MPTNKVRTIGIIRLADAQNRLEPHADPRDLASTLKWLVGDAEVASENLAPARLRLRADTVDKLQSANSIRVSADLDTIYSQLEDELRRLSAC